MAIYIEQLINAIDNGNTENSLLVKESGLPVVEKALKGKVDYKFVKQEEDNYLLITRGIKNA